MARIVSSRLSCAEGQVRQSRGAELEGYDLDERAAGAPVRDDTVVVAWAA